MGTGKFGIKLWCYAVAALLLRWYAVAAFIIIRIFIQESKLNHNRPMGVGTEIYNKTI